MGCFSYGKFKVTNGIGCNTALSLKPRILLVEDAPIIQKVHELMLKKLGCKIDIASNGKEALRKIKNKYELIFMDIGLPDIDGVTLAKQMRRYDNKIPIVALTAFDVKEILDESIEAGIDDILIKPIPLEQLKIILNRYVQWCLPEIIACE